MMPRTKKKLGRRDPKDVINWSELSMALTGSRFNIRSNYYAEVYSDKINRIIEAIDREINPRPPAKKKKEEVRLESYHARTNCETWDLGDNISIRE